MNARQKILLSGVWMPDMLSCGMAKTNRRINTLVNSARPLLAKKEIAKVVKAAMVLGTRSAIAYISPRLIVKATRGYPLDKRVKSTTVILTIGVPNFRERAFIRACQKAGEPFPVKKLQLRWFAV